MNIPSEKYVDDNIDRRKNETFKLQRDYKKEANRKEKGKKSTKKNITCPQLIGS